MARIDKVKQLETRERQNRYFSDEFKRRKVDELDKNLTTVSELCKEYRVSGSSVYKWIYKYSKMRKKEEKQVYESQSDTRKLKELQEHVKELERIIGLKQLKIDFLEEVIDRTEKTYSVDVKKKFLEKPFKDPGSNENLKGKK